MSKKIRIGTRNSALALWQAHFISNQLLTKGIATEIVEINTKGDQIHTTPLYSFGVTGVFTRSLDIALLENRIDIAVHSMKDVPTILPQGIVSFAIPQRGTVTDLMVYNGSQDAFTSAHSRTIATSSLRRKAQWLHQFPDDTITDIRGNVITRLETLKHKGWNGAIFAQVGLDRINMRPSHAFPLDWMICAPAQGALWVLGRQEDTSLKEIFSFLNHPQTILSVEIEREFLHALEGGCSAPIGAHAQIKDDKIIFKGRVTSLDGTQQIDLNTTIDYAISRTINSEMTNGIGAQWAQDIRNLGAQPILSEIQNQKV